MFLVSKVMPKKVRTSEGPSTFSRASGIPREEYTSLIVARLFAHIEEPGGPKVRNHPNNGTLAKLLFE